MRTAWNNKHIALLVFAACMFFLNWPFVTIPEDNGRFGAVLHLFLLWAIAIAFLRFYCRSKIKELEATEEKDESL